MEGFNNGFVEESIKSSENYIDFLDDDKKKQASEELNRAKK